MIDARQRANPFRPWYAAVALFFLLGFAAFYLLTPSQALLGESTISELGAWAFALGGLQIFLVLLLVALFHQGPGVMYCEKGIPGITTWSAGMVTLVSMLLVAFAGLTVGASVLAEPGRGREDFVAMTLWAFGGWLAAIAFVPLRRRIRLNESRGPDSG